jgi:hypothetical protein
MTLSTLLLSVTIFYIGFLVGRASNARRAAPHESLAEVATRFYSRGYGAAIKEFGVERRQTDRRFAAKLRIVGGKDTESA